MPKFKPRTVEKHSETTQPTDLLQVVYFTGLLQCIICRLVTAWLKQVAASLWITSLRNKPARSLFTNCNSLSFKKKSLQKGHHCREGTVLIAHVLQSNSLLQWGKPCANIFWEHWSSYRLAVTSYCKTSTDMLRFAPFWLSIQLLLKSLNTIVNSWNFMLW